MRSYKHSDKYDREEWAKLKGEPWMLDLLKMNPEYVHWGPGEDYMDSPNYSGKGGGGWGASVGYKTWKDFGPWSLDELNECVHFHFNVERAAHRCDACEGTGHNPETLRISKTFYDHNDLGVKGWHDQITQEEVQALLDNNRLVDFTRIFENGKWVKSSIIPSAEEVNAKQRERGPGVVFMQHDGINRCILIEARAKRLGVWGPCEHCGGEGRIYDEPTAHVGITLWMLHPRKGASRGVEIDRIEKEDVPAVLEFLAEAAERNAKNFAKVVRQTKKLAKAAKGASKKTA